MMNIGFEKWCDLSKDLRAEQGGDASFDDVYLIDDFTASGTTFIRHVKGKGKGNIKNSNDAAEGRGKSRKATSRLPRTARERRRLGQRGRIRSKPVGGRSIKKNTK